MNTGKIKRYLIFLSTLFTVSLLFTSCETLNSTNKTEDNSEIEIKDLPRWTVSINEIVKYPRASQGEIEVPTFSGRTIWVRRHYELNSKSIESIKKISDPDRPGYYNLQVKLDRHGSLVGMRLCSDTTHAPWAFLVDGTYYRSVEFKEPPVENDFSEIIIKGPFDKSLATFIAKYSEPNYEHFHPNN